MAIGGGGIKIQEVYGTLYLSNCPKAEK